jgi:glucose/arabinose dehydrogenase
LVAGETTLFRLRLGDDLREAERSVVLDGLSTGGHSTRTVAVLPDGQLLLSAGSTCNVCIETDERRAAINLVPAEGGSSRVYMTGLRNAVGLWIDPATGRAWATNMGRDWMGDDLPPETVYEVVDGADAGWPRCHAGDLVDPEFGGEGACDGVAQPAVTFGAHTAPLALLEWEDHLVVALHGSWNRGTKVGYAIWWLAWDGQPAGEPEPFATGFLPEGVQDALGRPAGLAVGADGALYVSDDKAGFIYRIARR